MMRYIYALIMAVFLIPLGQSVNAQSVLDNLEQTVNNTAGVFGEAVQNATKTGSEMGQAVENATNL